MQTFFRIWKSIPKVVIALLLAGETALIVSPLAGTSFLICFKKMLPVIDRLGIKGVALISTLLVVSLTVACLVLVLLDMIFSLCREITDVVVNNIPAYLLTYHPFVRDIISREEQLARNIFLKHAEDILAQYQLRAESDNLLSINYKQIREYFDRLRSHLIEVEWTQLTKLLICNSQISAEQRNIEYIEEDVKLIYCIYAVIVVGLVDFVRISSMGIPLWHAIWGGALLGLLLLPVLRRRKLKLAQMLLYYQLERFTVTTGVDLQDRDIPQPL